MIWAACHGERFIHPISGRLYRLVESQEQIATMGYVDTLEEQALLEQLLEEAKPSYPDEVDNERYDYLLTTPFRYPPLQYGSRFGRVTEPSLFYAGCQVETTLAESAFYRFVFITSISGVEEGDKMRTEHTLFCVDYQTQKGIQLQYAPFKQYESSLTHPAQYHDSQQLGQAMREAGVEAFEYQSARDHNKGCCVALFHSSPFVQKKPIQQDTWLCETSINEVRFKPLDDRQVVHFSLSDFLLDGVFPQPA